MCKLDGNSPDTYMHHDTDCPTVVAQNIQDALLCPRLARHGKGYAKKTKRVDMTNLMVEKEIERRAVSR